MRADAAAPRWWAQWGRPFGQTASLRDYGVTFAAEFGTLAAGLLVLRLAASNWGTVGFGEYILVRRTLSLLQLPILCNMGIAISRYVAIAGVKAAQHTRATYLLAATAVATSVSVACAGFLLLLAGPVASLMFGSAQFAPDIRVIALALPGLALHGVAYGYYRGRLQMLVANALQVLNLALVPLAAMAILGASVQQAVLALAVAWNVVAIAFIVPPLLAARAEGHAGIRDAIAELLRFGVPRVPGEFALAALFSLPTTITAHLGGVEQAGFVGLGVSLLSMVGSMYAPLGQIVLPSVSAMAARGETGTLRRDVQRLWLACVASGAAMVVVLAASARLLVTLYVGATFLPAVPVVRLVLLAGVPHITYVVLRNVLDALDPRPLNARNLVVALVVFVAVALAIRKPEAVGAAAAEGVTVLGGLSLRDTHRLLQSAT